MKLAYFAALCFVAQSSQAMTPAKWVFSYSDCVRAEIDKRLAVTEKKLTKEEARALAEVSGWACEHIMSRELTSVERLEWIHHQSETSVKLIRKLSAEKAK